MRTLLRFTVVYCFALLVASGQLTVKPQNVVGKVGSSVSLACGADPSVDLAWDEYITNAATGQAITIRDIFIKPKTKYGLLTTPSGNYQLTVKLLILNDAGTYKCKFLQDASVDSGAEVIIFEGDPVCGNNITSNEAVEGDYIEYSCEVKYQGKWAPVMEWKNSNGGLRAMNETTANTVTYTHVTELTPEDNGQIYTCRTYFDQPKPGTEQDEEADNIPTTDNVLTKYISPPLTVYYGPRSLMVKPVQDSYYPGDTVKVTAESNPSDRTYEWANTTTNGTLDTKDTITITEEMLGNQSLKVIVCNIIPIPTANTICKERRLNFTVIPKPTTTTTTTTTPATTTAKKTPVLPSGGSATTTVKPSDKPDENGSGRSTDETGKQTLTTGAIVGIALGAVAFIIILICCCVYFIRIRKRKSADESHPMHMDSTHRKQQVPVDQVRSPDILNPTYGRQNEFTPSLNDSVPPPTRTPEDITYADLAMMHDNQADLAIDDVPRSRKPLQVFEPGSGVEYASIQPNHRTH